MEEIRVRSEINRVSVYPDRALVTRRCFVELEPGSCEIVFDEMPSAIIPGSLRAKGTILGAESGSGGLKLLSIDLRPVEGGERVGGDPKGRRKKLEEARGRVRGRLENLRLRRSFFMGVAARSRDHISRQLVQRDLSVEDCEKISDFLFQNLGRTDDEIRKVQGKEKELEERIAGEAEEARSGPAAAEPIYQVRLGVHVPSKIKGVLELSYITAGSRWVPFYEVHGGPGEETVTLQAYGIVSQTTGEPWPDVKMNLSTTQPPIGASRPELEPLFLRPPPADGGGQDAAGGPGGKGQEAEPAFLVPEGSGWNFDVARPGSVPPDGTPVRALIGQWEMKAEYEYVCIPKLSENAFLRARIRNTRRTDLLPGQVNIFSNSDFVGTTEIPFVPPSEEFEVYLGLYPGIRIRHQTDREGKGKRGVISKVHRKGLKIRMTIHNQKAKEKPIVLMERIPVSKHKEIRIKDSKFSDEPKKKNRNGIVTWSFSLRPREKREISYSYTVEYPRGMRLQV